MDVPNDVSRIFEMIDYPTREKVIGRNTYNVTEADINDLFINNSADICFYIDILYIAEITEL